MSFNSISMLRRIIPVGVTALLITSVNAQVSFGVRGGANWAKMTAQEGLAQKVGSRLGVEAGIAIGVPVAKWLTLGPELAYVQRGYHRDNIPGSVFPEERLVLGYADLAILGRIHPANGTARPYVTIGATMGRLLSACLYQTDPWTRDEQGIMLDPSGVNMGPWSAKTPMNRWNLGLCAGLGFSFAAGTSQVMVEVRYRHGLTNIWNGVPVTDVNGAPVGELNGSDRSISATLAWMLPVGKQRSAGAAPAAQ
ncbi:MAG: porin family protein [Flavobacteriales bacterium]